MLIYLPNCFNLEFQNRKIFEDLQQEKKNLLKQGVATLNSSVPGVLQPPRVSTMKMIFQIENMFTKQKNYKYLLTFLNY